MSVPTRTDALSFCYDPCYIKETLNNSPSASTGKFAFILSHFFLQYTKYSCEKVPSSEHKFSQYLLSAN